MTDTLCLEESCRFFRCLVKRKFMSKEWDILFSNAKRMNLKVSMLPISNLCKRFRIPLSP